jgi:hypothetical protein
MKDEVNGELG